jgi:hypothetical protein
VLANSPLSRQATGVVMARGEPQVQRPANSEWSMAHSVRMSVRSVRKVSDSACTRSTAKPLSGVKKVTRSPSPAISSDGTRGQGEEAVKSMLLKVNPVG